LRASCDNTRRPSSKEEVRGPGLQAEGRRGRGTDRMGLSSPARPPASNKLVRISSRRLWPQASRSRRALGPVSNPRARDAPPPQACVSRPVNEAVDGPHGKAPGRRGTEELGNETALPP
jgi:hypothetical protein